MYKCDAFYNKEAEAGILFSDEEIGIDWGVKISDAIVSEKDLKLPPFRQSISNFE
jgi:dTDP-4-dehydrorhamnose 3,5-epimerase